MKLSLINKHAIVCGSTDGIGKASALLLAKQGCEITLVARNQDKLDKTQSELNTNHNQKHYSVCADFDNSMDLKKKIKMHIHSLGRSVDILVNNSGGPHGGPLIEADEDEFRAAFERLLIGNHIMAKAVVPGMKDKGVGRIVNIISTSVKQVIPGLGVSNTIRGSVAQWGKTLALELGEHGICVNNILPGYTATDRLKYLAESKANSLGVDIEDINNDNLSDIFVLDMASSDHVRSKTLMASMNTSNFDLITNKLDQHYQYMFNSLQLNLGNDKYHNISHQLNIAKTDWSWAGLIFDYNLDGKEDIFVTNGYRKYGSDNDSRIKINNAKKEYNNKVPLEIKKMLYDELPSEKLPNLLFKNKGNLTFSEVGYKSELNDPSFSNGAAYADLDNDGDLEIIVNNIDENAFIYKNLSVENELGNYLVVQTVGNLSESFAKGTIYFENNSKSKESKRVRGYLSSVSNELYFGLGKTSKIDSLVIEWNSGKKEVIYDIETNKTIIVNEKDSKSLQKEEVKSNKIFSKISGFIEYAHIENKYNDFSTEILLPYKQSTLGPYISVGDVNNDGKEDIFIGGAHKQNSKIFISNDDRIIEKNIESFNRDSANEDMESIFIDIDNDNDLDLYVVSGGNEFINRSVELSDRIYLNDGKGNFIKDIQNDIENYTISGKTVASIDFDNDGDKDIIVGNRIKTGKYPIHEPSIIYENISGKFYNNTYNIAPEFENFGIVNKIISTDFNNDGWSDFIAVGEWTNIGLFLNENGRFKNISSKSNLHSLYGLWFNIQETDINNDGLYDYLIGNIGKNSKYKTSNKKPLKIFGNDFDRNGTHDLVLSYKYEGNYVPLRGKECSTQQMPFISEKIPTFEEFANASIEDIYGDEIVDAYERKVTSFESIILINKGENKFEIEKLPPLAQSIPILTSDTYDINGDGYEDVIVGGNIYNTEVETPRLDNQFALILISDKNKNYNAIGPNESGLYLSGNTKSLKIINHKNPKLLVANNNSRLEVFELNK